MQTTTIARLAAAAVSATLGVAFLAGPASAAPGRQTVQMNCTGLGTMTLIVAPTDQDNWGAAQLLSGGHLVPVGFRHLVHDDTAGITLFDGTVSHGAAHANQDTVTCSTVETGVLGQIAPPGFTPPPGVSLTDLVTISFIATAVPHL